MELVVGLLSGLLGGVVLLLAVAVWVNERKRDR